MSNSIISNIAAFNAQGNITRAASNAAASIARLSSGNAINKASDDVAGLATGTALRTQVTTLRQALANASQGSSLLQVADGALSQIVDILQRQKAIATQASSGQLTDTNRSLLNQEFQNLTAEVDRLASTTNFNGVSLLAGGLGTKTQLQRTDTLAIASVKSAPSLGGSNTTIASTVAIQAFSTSTGQAALANGTTLGNLTVTDSTGTLLTNNAYLGVDSSLYGQFSGFSFSNITYGAAAAGSATLSATINGVTYSGNVTGGAGATAVLQNGNTYIKVGLGTVSFADNTATDNTRANITAGFKDTTIARTSSVNGVDFTGTTLSGTIGQATQFVTTRLANAGQFNISNFQYVSNTGAANTNTLSVTVNGTNFTATSVKDSLTAAGTLQFTDAQGLQSFDIDTTGLTTATGNIRTDTTARANVIAALNQGFSKAGGSGLNFTIGSTTTDAINVSLSSATTISLYNGASLDVSTAATATTASNVLDTALTKVVSLRAAVGALQSRFNFASNAIQSSIENQDAARAQLLDTDVSAESTKFASAQVQTQAGIAVLAQANQLPQTLLKLIQ